MQLIGKNIDARFQHSPRSHDTVNEVIMFIIDQLELAKAINPTIGGTACKADIAGGIISGFYSIKEKGKRPQYSIFNF